MFQAIIQCSYKGKLINQTGGEKNPNFGPDFACLAKGSSWRVLPLLVVRHWSKLSFYEIYRKTKEPNLKKWQKTNLGLVLACFDPKLFFVDFTSTKCHSQLSSCTISEKTNDPILRKLSDARTDRKTDGQTGTDRQEWFHRTLSH